MSIEVIKPPFPTAAQVGGLTPAQAPPVDPTDTNTTRDKRLSNQDAKRWEDHRTDTTTNPHGVTASQVGALTPAAAAATYQTPSQAITQGDGRYPQLADLANTSNPALGDALVGFKQQFNNSVGRTVDLKLAETLSSADFDTPQHALDAAAGQRLEIAPGNYNVTTTLSVPANTEVFSKRKWAARFYNTSTHMTLISAANGVSFTGIEVEGAGNSSYNASGIGIDFSGADATAYKSGLIIRDCYLHGFGYGAINAHFAQDIEVSRTRIFDCGYTGFAGISVTRANIDRCWIKGITPGRLNDTATATICYGAFFTRDAITSSLITYPRSKDCSVTNTLVEDNTIWEGLDTHAGDTVTFFNNTIRNCKIGISVVPTPATGTEDHAPIGCQVLYNKIYGLNTGIGISASGANGSTGTPTEHADSITVAGNQLWNCGENGNVDSGAILLQNTRGLNVSNNIARLSTPHSICFLHDNRDFVCTGNVSIDPYDTVQTATTHIAVRSTFNTGVIVGNIGRRENLSLTNIAFRGLWIVSTTSSTFVVTGNQLDATNPLSGVTGAAVTFNSYGNGPKEYANAGTPEAAITASIGSRCTDTTNGKLYIKETGSGNTGWVLK